MREAIGYSNSGAGHFVSIFTLILFYALTYA